MKNKIQTFGYIFISILIILLFISCGSYHKTLYPEKPIEKVISKGDDVIILTKDSLVIKDNIKDINLENLYFSESSELPVNNVDSIYVKEVSFWEWIIAPFTAVGVIILGGGVAIAIAFL
ncbi:MAG: hypothetical protein JXA68_10285 [Ignavibacteriales bacterium]|nr:hypothetical protein [Ignavibacteriales bacterium]